MQDRSQTLTPKMIVEPVKMLPSLIGDIQMEQPYMQWLFVQ